MREREQAQGVPSWVPLLVGVGVALGALTACDGSIGGGSDGGGGALGTAGTLNGGGSSALAGSGPGSDPNAVGPRPLSRLTRREYNNTVRDLLGDTTRPADAFPEDRDRAFLFRRSGLVATQDADLLRSAAETLAAAAIKSPSTLLPCDPSAGEDACAAKFINDFGLRAYRRPLADIEKTHLTALYQDARSNQKMSFNDAIGLLVEAILQSPAFLYHWESPYQPPTLAGNAVALGPYDVASRLSYFIWGSMPDQTLFDAAAGDKLTADADITAQARRMLADDRAADAVGDFFTDWLDVDRLPFAAKDSATYPAYGDGLIAAMMQEVRLFTSTIALAGSGRFDDILTATSSFADSQLASVYGLTGAAATSAFAPVSLPQAERSGLLTTAGFLALTGAPDGSDPPRRGKAVYVRLLCGTLPTPAPPMPAVAPATPGGPTTRQRFAAADGPDCAASCHSIIDPLGFAFEHYDGIGAYRTMDDGLPVDASATVSLDGRSIGVADARELLAALVTSDQAQSCFVRQWLRYALGRAETAADLASLETAQNVFTASMRNIRELLVAVATSRTFRYRTPGTGEVLP